MKPKETIALAGLAILLAALPARPLAAQAPPASVFGETVEVRVVNIEVVVTDRDGLPVTGLSAADFRLTVDGAEQPVRYFSEVRGGAAIAPEEASASDIEGVPSLAPGEPVGSSYLVFVDEYFSIARDRDRVLQALREEVGRLGPEDRMAIVAFDGNELTMLSSWTNSEQDLQRALRDAQARPARGLQRVAERRSFATDRRVNSRIPGIENSRLGALDTSLDAHERFFAETLESQIGNVVSGAAAALRGFANPPGRKVLLMYSGGWPYEITDYVAGEFGRFATDTRVERGEELYAPLVDTANQLGYTIFAIDVPGMGPDGTSDVELAEVAVGSARFASFLRENNIQYTLQRVAAATGGKALLNAGRLNALSIAEAATRTYYWIGFTPTWKGDDRRHEVDVEVLRQGLKVSSREGFVDFSRRAEVSAAVESVLLFGAGPGVRDLELQVGKPRSSGRTMQVPIVLSLPTDELTFLPSGTAHLAELELRVSAVDNKGGRSEMSVIPIRLSLPAAPPSGSRARYETQLELRRVENRVAVAVYDPVSGAIWSKIAEIRP